MGNIIKSIGLGGGCHWCTEAVFQSLRGVVQVDQGYIAGRPPHHANSEAVIVHYNPLIIPLPVLIEIHLLTHKSTKMHSMRDTYRSAIYVYEEDEYAFAKAIVSQLQSNFQEPIITIVLYLEYFTTSREEIKNYYLKDPNKPFCERYIEPKLEMLRKEFSSVMKKF